MSRVEIDFSNEKVIFKTTIPVLVNHLNYGNHLGHDSTLAIIQEARMRFLKSHDMNEINIEKDVGCLIVNLSIAYKSEAFHGDLLEVELAISDINKKTCTLKYRVMNSYTNKLIAIAQTKLCFYDFKNKNIVSIPLSFMKII